MYLGRRQCLLVFDRFDDHAVSHFRQIGAFRVVLLLKPGLLIDLDVYRRALLSFDFEMFPVDRDDRAQHVLTCPMGEGRPRETHVQRCQDQSIEYGPYSFPFRLY